MNEQVQSQISQILAQISMSVSEVKDFSIDQLPDIAQQYIQYATLSNTITMILAGAFFILGIIGIYKGITIMSNDPYGEGDTLITISLFIGIPSFVSFIMATYSMVLIHTAPKVWFILKIKNLFS
jgi:hypothetical protein